MDRAKEMSVIVLMRLMLLMPVDCSASIVQLILPLTLLVVLSMLLSMAVIAMLLYGSTKSTLNCGDSSFAVRSDNITRMVLVRFRS